MRAGRGAATIEIPVPQAERDHIGQPDRPAAREQRLGVVRERGVLMMSETSLTADAPFAIVIDAIRTSVTTRNQVA